MAAQLPVIELSKKLRIGYTDGHVKLYHLPLIIFPMKDCAPPD